MMLKWKWFVLETKRCKKQQTVLGFVGFVMNVSLFSIFSVSHAYLFFSYLILFLYSDFLHLIFSRYDSILSFSLSHTGYPSFLPLEIYSSAVLQFSFLLICQSNVLHNSASEIYPLVLSFATPQSMPAHVPPLFSPLTINPSITAADTVVRRGEYTIILYVMRLYPVFEHIKGLMNIGMQCIVFFNQLHSVVECYFFVSTELLKFLMFVWRRWSPKDCCAVLSRGSVCWIS